MDGKRTKVWVDPFAESTTEFFTGVIDDVRIYGGAISDAEITALALDGDSTK